MKRASFIIGSLKEEAAGAKTADVYRKNGIREGQIRRRWLLDFHSVMLIDSRHFRILAMVDNFTRERSLEYGSAANAMQTYPGTGTVALIEGVDGDAGTDEISGDRRKSESDPDRGRESADVEAETRSFSRRT